MQASTATVNTESLKIKIKKISPNSTLSTLSCHDHFSACVHELANQSREPIGNHFR